MRLYAPIAKLDEEQRLVLGYASTEALDSQGEIIRREAIEAALPQYMRFANIREMHQPSAVGVAEAADIDAKGLYLVAKVIDDDAWRKVKAGVYKGFSIGGRALERDAADRRVVTRLELSEISLVDRPANPEAVIDLYKREPDALGKVGARNSAADLARIQRVHDTAVELGACCGDEAKLAAEGDVAKAEALRDAALAKVAALDGELRALAATVREQGRVIERLAAMPAPPKYALEARAVEKAEDDLAKATDDAPKTPLEAIRKAHRNPIRLGLP
jgi:HK97 family phage prohead protease